MPDAAPAPTSALATSFSYRLVRLNVDVIVVPINPIIADAKRATTKIPIVMLCAVDPEGAGFVASLAKPGGNVTGLTMGQAPETFVKNLQLLKEASPQLACGPSQAEMDRRVAVFVDKILKGAKPGDLPIEDRISPE